MLLVSFGFFILAGVYVLVVPGKLLKILFSIYFLMLYITLGGFLGFLQSLSDKNNSLLTLVSIYAVVVVIHLPLLLKIWQLDIKQSKIIRARDFFGKDVLHLTNEQLHLHIKKHH